MEFLPPGYLFVSSRLAVARAGLHCCSADKLHSCLWHTCSHTYIIQRIASITSACNVVFFSCYVTGLDRIASLTTPKFNSSQSDMLHNVTTRAQTLQKQLVTINSRIQRIQVSVTHCCCCCFCCFDRHPWCCCCDLHSCLYIHICIHIHIYVQHEVYLCSYYSIKVYIVAGRLDLYKHQPAWSNTLRSWPCIWTAAVYFIHAWCAHMTSSTHDYDVVMPPWELKVKPRS